MPASDYILHFWIEGVPQSVLDGLNRRVHPTPGLVDLGQLRAPIAQPRTPTHSNKFGRAYDTVSKSNILIPAPHRSLTLRLRIQVEIAPFLLCDNAMTGR